MICYGVTFYLITYAIYLPSKCHTITCLALIKKKKKKKKNHMYSHALFILLCRIKFSHVYTFCTCHHVHTCHPRVNYTCHTSTCHLRIGFIFFFFFISHAHAYHSFFKPKCQNFSCSFNGHV